MGRQRVHQPHTILDAARTLVLEQGAGAATVGAIAGASGAPVGSIYHAFGSRDVLLARLWIRAVERSQTRFLEALADAGDPLDGAVAAALSVYDFARDEPGDARLLVSLRREDLIQMPLPADVATELAELNRPIEKSCRRAGAPPVRAGRQGARRAGGAGGFRPPLWSAAAAPRLRQRPPAAIRPALARAVRAALDRRLRRNVVQPGRGDRPPALPDGGGA